MLKSIVFRWQKKFQDAFTYLKDGSRPGQPKTVATNANIVPVAGLIKRDIRLSVKYIAHSVGISSCSAHDILTQQLKLEKFVLDVPLHLTKEQKGYSHENA